ncbi:Crp/Fnr family transcriptional regulator [Urechidicola croceus]|uniref:Cyclic nucleotide-binding domain-containing protein n=1 Tax=Urechidicola croceus TaxID=1850246 RepID=A0A1D8P6L6_9FLAO|nr:Crp/Fnr family transcriptional regulator [Urechidicola croceus]AOW20221.1 hypothetical protein LPB138_05815 [Urechidicola croceus]
MNRLIEHINKTHSLSATSWVELNKIITYKKVRQGSKLIEIGNKPKYFYFLITGIVRVYTITKNGKESNSLLIPEYNYFAPFTSLILDSPSAVTVECLTDCELAECNYKLFIKLADEYTDINILHRKNLEKIFINSEKRDIELTTLTATERYIALKNRIPNIDNLITQKHIASHIGITAVQLSRLKKQLFT